jgi:hypothetical protein
MAIENITQTCSLTHCDLPHRANGYCNPHNQRVLMHGDDADLLKPIRHHVRKVKYTGCKVDDCDGTHQARGYCVKHYERWLDKGDPLFAAKGTLANPWRMDDPEFALHFWNNVKITSNPDKCWEWKRKADANGYGNVTVDGKTQRAHRIAWRIFNQRDIQDELFILHSCDNRVCVNPYHLREGTAQDNSDDMVNRNRHKVWRTKWDTEESVIREIKRLRQENVPIAVIAERLNVGRSLVSHVSSGRTWKHVNL